MKNKVLFSFILALLVLIVPNTKVFAAGTAVVWSDDHLFQSYNRAYYVGNALRSSGYNTTVNENYTFSANDVLSTVGPQNVFYYNGHGNNDGGNDTCVQTANGDILHYYNFRGFTNGLYNIVYFSTCHVGETNQMANAFNISSSSNTAFVGFKDTIKQDWNQTVFDKTVFEDLASGENINSSVWDARTKTGITNYRIYGNYSTTLNRY